MGNTSVIAICKEKMPLRFELRWKVDSQEISFWDALNSHWLEAVRYFVWVAAVRLKIVQKESIALEIEYSYKEIHHDDIMKMCFEHIQDVRYRTGKRPDTLLMGSEQYWELDKVESFRIERAYCERSRNSETVSETVFGLRVVIIPWMDGILAVHSSDVSGSL